MSKYNIVYKITNKLNGKIYIGCHQTENIDDSYMGSGLALHRAFKKYGVENFTKEILFKFDSKDLMFEKEASLVNENFVKRQDTYNLKTGGNGGFKKGVVTVKDKNGKTLQVNINDSRYLSGELKHITYSKATLKDKNGKYHRVDRNDPRYLSGELHSVLKNKVITKDKNGKTFQVDKDDPRYLNGDLVSIQKGKLLVKDKDGKFYQVDKDDPRYLNGELVHFFKGNKLSKEHKEKISKANKIAQKGERNSQYGKCWIYNLELKQSIRIKKEDLNAYLERGWLKGRKIKFD